MNDTAFTALANEHRRSLLVGLLEEHPQDAAAFVSVGGDAEVLETEHRSQTEMYHRHLPKLADYGYIH